jgi:hypothetical protein
MELVRPETTSFEYRHTPDPREIEQLLLPMLETIRAALPPGYVATPTGHMRRSHEN